MQQVYAQFDRDPVGGRGDGGIGTLASDTRLQARVAWWSGNGEDAGTRERFDASTPRRGTG